MMTEPVDLGDDYTSCSHAHLKERRIISYKRQPFAELVEGKYGKRRGRWSVYNTRLMADNFTTFATLDEATKFVVLLHKNTREHVEARPLTQEMMDFMTTCARDLREEHGRLSSQIFGVICRRQRLLSLCKRYGVDESLVYLEESDVDQVVQDLLDFKLDGEEVPLVSETWLYEKIGKDAARSFRARLHRLIRLISPGKEHTW